MANMVPFTDLRKSDILNSLKYLTNYLMQVQDLRKPRHSRILCSLHAILLLGVARVTSN